MTQAIFKFYLYIGILGFLYVPLSCILAVIRKYKYKKFFRNLPLALLFFVQAALYTGVQLYTGTDAAKQNPSAFIYLITAGTISFVYVLVQMIDLLFCKKKAQAQTEAPRIRV